jgi:Cu(I)/Ag(I) efflux system membrane protein CusA/SilA
VAIRAEVRGVLSQLPGVRSVTLESSGEEPRLAFVADEAMTGALGVESARARDTARAFASGGQIATLKLDGESRRVRLRPSAGEMTRTAEDLLRELTVAPRGEGSPVPLALLGRSSTGSEVALQRSERGELVGYVLVDLRDGTNVEDFVKLGQRALEAAASTRALDLGPAERTDWIGQYVLMAAGAQRLRWILPLVALSMFLLLYLQFRSVVEALIVLSAVPFALVGSVWALTFAGYPLSAPVWVGLLSVLGLAMQTGVVMVVYIDDAFYRRVAAGTLRTREDIVLAHAEGTIARLRPKLMTIGTMAAGLLPLAFSEGAGAEIMRRVAVPMLGGLLTSAFLTLEVLPVLYTLWRERQLARAVRLGVPIAEVTGAAPAWVTAR